MNVRTMRGANVDSDHFLVKMKYRARLATKKCNIKNDTKKWNLKKESNIAVERSSRKP